MQAQRFSRWWYPVCLANMPVCPQSFEISFLSMQNPFVIFHYKNCFVISICIAYIVQSHHFENYIKACLVKFQRRHKRERITTKWYLKKPHVIHNLAALFLCFCRIFVLFNVHCMILENTEFCALCAPKKFLSQNFQDGWSYCHFSLGDHGHTGSMSEWWSWTLDFDQVMVGHSNLTPPFAYVWA